MQFVGSGGQTGGGIYTPNKAVAMSTLLGFLDARLFVELGVVALPFLLPNAWVEKLFYGFGRAASVFLRQKVGKGSGEKIEGYFQLSLKSAVDGLNRGLDQDDKE